ncbi:diguanylate cyclase (GGDEF)-like protein/PAS domain S-box-containing protein [Achromobacter deleyi]|uniref:sensor domain-containing protein n=1 Tax=Achromobacter TaxID=222 RepID=UPI001E56BFBD|nr:MULTISPECIES: EAL domain-containing protein [Achromobacter]MDR6604852.1 diguanylate cyclase (GGDEF)-like protein/PAS domain S-box-containing protein [Achromobacter deleyi]
MLDSHVSDSSAGPEGAAWHVGNYLTSMDQALLLFDFDASGSLLNANANFLAAVGYTAEEALTLRHDMLCDSMDEGKGLASGERIWTRLRRGEHFSGTCRYRKKDGGSLWIEATYLPLRDDGGDIARIAVISRKSIADAERQEEIRLLLLGINETGNAVAVSGSDGRIVYVNDGFQRMLGFGRGDALHQELGELLAGGRPDGGTREELDRRIACREGYHKDVLVYDRCGKPLWVSVMANSVFDDRGTLVNIVDVLTDITPTKVHEVLQRRVLQAMVNEASVVEVMNMVCREVERLAPEVVATVLRVDDAGQLRQLAAPSMPAAYADALDGLKVGPQSGACGTSAFLGRPVIVPDIATDPLWDDYRHLPLPEDVKACWSSPIKSSDGRVIGTFCFYFRERRLPDDFHHRLVDVCVYLCALALEREEARARIRQLAFYDELTGLPNRNLLLAQAEQAIARAEPERKRVAVLFLDLDRFKQVNDTLGHPIGDALLRDVAQRLRRLARASDIVGRLSGDEFVMMMPDFEHGRLTAAAEHILVALAQPFSVGGVTLNPSVSIGISVFPENGRDMDTLLRHADMAMYQAKTAGRNRISFFSAEMNRQAQERLALEAALRDALEAKALRLHYQPQVGLKNGSLYGVEALARWRHPTLGDISPARFVPLAEECGLIGDLGDWALREACSQLAVWRSNGLRVPSVSVNLSATNFHNLNLPRMIAATLAEFGLAPADLMLEITEGVVLDATAGTLRTIAELHRLGVRLSMDDFGTGYSSLGHLRRLIVDELKLDRSFVQGLESDDAARALTSAVIRIGESLSLPVVAEGVENEEQRRFLIEQGCAAGQGFLFSPPLPAKDLEEWLRGRI